LISHTAVNNIAVDHQGNIYTAEVATGEAAVQPTYRQGRV
jgi:hypothetical protein